MLNPPSSLSPELRKYLNYMSDQVNKLDNKLGEIPRITDIPDKPIIGKLYYFLNAVSPTITDEGVWVYKSTGWVYVG
jgi:hypothetical protein